MPKVSRSIKIKTDSDRGENAIGTCQKRIREVGYTITTDKLWEISEKGIVIPLNNETALKELMESEMVTLLMPDVEVRKKRYDRTAKRIDRLTGIPIPEDPEDPDDPDDESTVNRNDSLQIWVGNRLLTLDQCRRVIKKYGFAISIGELWDIAAKEGEIPLNDKTKLIKLMESKNVKRILPDEYVGQTRYDPQGNKLLPGDQGYKSAVNKRDSLKIDTDRGPLTLGVCRKRIIAATGVKISIDYLWDIAQKVKPIPLNDVTKLIKLINPEDEKQDTASYGISSTDEFWLGDVPNPVPSTDNAEEESLEIYTDLGPQTLKYCQGIIIKKYGLRVTTDELLNISSEGHIIPLNDVTKLRNLIDTARQPPQSDPIDQFDIIQVRTPNAPIFEAEAGRRSSYDANANQEVIQDFSYDANAEMGPPNAGAEPFNEFGLSESGNQATLREANETLEKYSAEAYNWVESIEINIRTLCKNKGESLLNLNNRIDNETNFAAYGNEGLANLHTGYDTLLALEREMVDLKRDHRIVAFAVRQISSIHDEPQISVEIKLAEIKNIVSRVQRIKIKIDPDNYFNLPSPPQPQTQQDNVMPAGPFNTVDDPPLILDGSSCQEDPKFVFDENPSPRHQSDLRLFKPREEETAGNNSDDESEESLYHKLEWLQEKLKLAKGGR